METIHAIFEGGAFHPTTPVTLPERTEVEIELRVVEKKPIPTLDDVYAILNKRFRSGDSDVSARHNEHMP